MVDFAGFLAFKTSNVSGQLLFSLIIVQVLSEICIIFTSEALLCNDSCHGFCYAN